MNLTLEETREMVNTLAESGEEISDHLSRQNNKYTPEFYTMKQRGLHVLNKVVAGEIHPMEQEKPLDIVAALDVPNHTLTLLTVNGEKTIRLEELSQEYTKNLLQFKEHTNLLPNDLAEVLHDKSFPLTATAMKTVDAMTKDENKPDLKEMNLKSFPKKKWEKESDASRRLQQAFANEMVMMVQLEDYIEKNALDAMYATHKDIFSGVVQVTEKEGLTAQKKVNAVKQHVKSTPVVDTETLDKMLEEVDRATQNNGMQL